MARRITLKDLIGAKLLQVGEELACEPQRGTRQVYHASLNAEGLIEYENTSFKNPSAWAKHLCGGERNGWDYVTARGEKLDYFRKQFNRGVESPERSASPVVEPEPVPESKPTGSSSSVENLQSEVDTLKAQVANQQSAIASLNKKIGSLPASRPEDDAEDDVIGYLRERVLKLDPGEFERLVGEYLKAKGFSNVVVSGRSHDGGIDGECELPLIDVKVAFQAKRYAVGNNIGIDPVQRLNGSLGSSYDRGLFITTSEFTSFAKGWVEEEQVKIALIDGSELVTQMIEMGLGVKTIPVVRQEVDEGFFAGLGE